MWQYLVTFVTSTAYPLVIESEGLGVLSVLGVCVKSIQVKSEVMATHDNTKATRVTKYLFFYKCIHLNVKYKQTFFNSILYSSLSIFI